MKDLLERTVSEISNELFKFSKIHEEIEIGN
jgi:hypothetical protein